MSHTSEAVQTQSGQAERRAAVRSRVFKGAKIITLDKQSIFDCTIRNRSSCGAWLLFPSLIGIPNEFYCLVGIHSRLIRCAVARRTAAGCGVRFVSGGGHADAAFNNRDGPSPEHLAARIQSALDALDRGDTAAARHVLMGNAGGEPGPTVN